VQAEDRRELTSIKGQLRQQLRPHAPVTNPPPTASPLQKLRFEEDGTRVAYRGEEWTVELLAKADVQLAAYAADVLADSSLATDKNNRACALLFGLSPDLQEVATLLTEAKTGSEAAAHNERLLPEISIWLEAG
jgi:hypothetical protein